MIFSETQLTPQKLKTVLGKPIELNPIDFKSIGTPYFFLKKFRNKSSNLNGLDINSRCSFQKYEKGFLLRFNSNNKVQILPLINEEILQLKISGGKESFSPLPFSAFWLLVKIGFSRKKVKRFAIWPKEYSISPLKLELEN